MMLLMTQIVLLGVGILVHSKLPRHAERLQKPANLLTGALSLVVFGPIIAVQYKTFAEIRRKGFVGINLLVVICLVGGWILGGEWLEFARRLA
jgi:prepilin signal peptidase PulO-like enzyme (type II secretory pathway)